MTESKRVRGPFVVVGLAVLIAGVVTFAMTMWFTKREPRGPILAVQPMGDGSVAMLRRGFEERGYIHVVTEENGAQRWSEALFGVPEDASLVAFGDVVALRAREARGHVEIHAFDRRTGEFRWRGGRGTHETAEENPQGLPAFGERSLFATEDALFVVLGGTEPEVVVLANDGTERGRSPLPGGDAERGATLVGDLLVIASGDGSLRAIDEAAQVRMLATITHGWCATERAVYVGNAEGLAVHRAAEVEALRLGDGLPIGVHACTEREDGAWLVVTTPSGERALQRVGSDALLGGWALPAELGTVGLRLEGELLFDGAAVRRVGETVELVAENVDDFGVLAGEAVVRRGDEVMRGETRVEVEDARGLATDGESAFVWSETELVTLDASLQPRHPTPRVRTR